jgi:O-antigen/teichoic acid export membrane protein
MSSPTVNGPRVDSPPVSGPDAATATAPAVPGSPYHKESHHHVRAVARGGAFNLVGSIVYGVASFVLLAVLTRELGAERAGPAIVAIAVFTIMSRFAELGGSTGLVRTLSRDRALGRIERIRPTVIAAIVPVFTLGVLFAFLLWIFAPALAQLFSAGDDTEEITRLLRVLAPFLPISASYGVLVIGSRGFDTMWLQVWMEKITRACVMPIAVYLVIQAGGGPVGAITAWVLTTFAVALVTVVLFIRLMRKEEALQPVDENAPPADFVSIARAYWLFTLPRAFGQAFNVAVLWFDTLFVAALIGATAGGIYAAGTRYLLIGTFIAEAIMQAVGPRVSGLLTLDKKDEARQVVAQTTTWQVAIIWPTYLLVGSFATVLLGVFGPEFVAAQAALIYLSLGMLVSCLGGPCDSVILMSGRSRQSLFNSAAALGVNIVGNLIFVPMYGISAAGAVWAVTLVVASGLPAIQSARLLKIQPWSMPMFRTMALSLGTVGVACVLARIALGETWTALIAATLVGGIAYSALTWRLRRSIHFQALLDSFRRERPQAVATARPS